MTMTMCRPVSCVVLCALTQFASVSDAQTVITSNRSQLLEVNLLDGRTTVFSGMSRSSWRSTGLKRHPVTNEIFAFASGLLFRIDPATGRETVVSRPIFGSFSYRFEFSGTERLAVGAGSAIHEIDIASGQIVSQTPIIAMNGETGNVGWLSKAPSGAIYFGVNTSAPASVPIIQVFDPATRTISAVWDGDSGTGPDIPTDWQTASGTFAGDGSLTVAFYNLSGDHAVLEFDVASLNRRLITAGAGFPGGPVGSGPFPSSIGTAGDIAVSSTEIYTVVPTNQIFAIDRVNGARRIVSSDAVGTGVAFNNPAGLLQLDSNRLLVANEQDYFEVNITTGDRTSGTDFNPVKAGPKFSTTGGLPQITSDSGAYFFHGSSQVWRVDRATGERTLITGPSLGSGPLPTAFRDIAKVEGGPILALDGSNSRVIAIDVATGDRTIWADNTIGTGTSLSTHARAIVVEPSGDALVLQGGTCQFNVLTSTVQFVGSNNIVRIDKTTKDRSQVSGPNQSYGGVEIAAINPVSGDLVFSTLRASAPPPVSSLTCGVSGFYLLDLPSGFPVFSTTNPGLGFRPRAYAFKPTGELIVQIDSGSFLMDTSTDTIIQPLPPLSGEMAWSTEPPAPPEPVSLIFPATPSTSEYEPEDMGVRFNFASNSQPLPVTVAIDYATPANLTAAFPKQWSITPSGSSVFACTLTFEFLPSIAVSLGLDPSQFRLWKSEDGVSWVQVPATLDAVAGRLVTQSPQSSFSVWVIAEDQAVASRAGSNWNQLD